LTQREKLAELLFESVQAPAMYLARAPVLAAFSMGRSSAVVVDLGASCTRTTPVHEGYVLTKGMHLSEIGGAMLSEALHCALVRGRHVSGGELPPRYAFRNVSRKGRGAAAAAAAAAAASEGSGRAGAKAIA
jgi:actin-related protein